VLLLLHLRLLEGLDGRAVHGASVLQGQLVAGEKLVERGRQVDRGLLGCELLVLLAEARTRSSCCCCLRLGV